MRLTALLASFIALPALAEPIVPLDGLWTTRTVSSEIGEDCSEGLRPMLAPLIASLLVTQSEEMAWGGRFDPREMSGGPAHQSVTWTQLDDNTWEAVMADPELSEGRPAVGMRMEAVAPDRIEAAMIFDLEQMMGDDATDMEGVPIDAENCTLSLEAVSTLTR
ncbi:hypothetical protein [Jannaschia formosa]|uniref:hypothetical protein n=1 Tax=Jannaschia formosa TaxID=2259592 RepID=UPI000E1C26ED|nr:hypothetical protein [Jannaschia formosa]TFL18652.1 hypothetical protein DR046_09260 [Jannaschia formosa]